MCGGWAEGLRLLLPTSVKVCLPTELAVASGRACPGPQAEPLSAKFKKAAFGSSSKVVIPFGFGFVFLLTKI